MPNVFDCINGWAKDAYSGAQTGAWGGCSPPPNRLYLCKQSEHRFYVTQLTKFEKSSQI